MLDELIKLSQAVQACHRAAVDRGLLDVSFELRVLGQDVAALIAKTARAGIAACVEPAS